MLIIAMTMILCGILSILRSGALSGKVTGPSQLFEDGGLLIVLKHIFTHNPFTGFRQNILILIYGMAGLFLLCGGIFILIIVLHQFYFAFSR